jgi:hypothetical protein
MASGCHALASGVRRYRRWPTIVPSFSPATARSIMPSRR